MIISIGGTYFYMKDDSSAGSGNLEAMISKGIEDYVSNQQKKQADEYEEKTKELESKSIVSLRAYEEGVDHIFGPKNAKVSIIEYSDMECPYCKKNNQTINLLKDTYDNNVNFIYRHFPLSFHLPNAQDQAEASECVAKINGNDAFFVFVDEIFSRTSTNKGFSYEKIQPLAEEIGVDGTEFKKCMDGDEMLDVVNSNSEEISALGGEGTPINFVRNNETGNVKALPGAYPFDQFTVVIDEMLHSD